MATELGADLLFERHPDAMWIYDPATLGFLTVNEAAISRYGYSRDEFLRMTIADIRPVEDVAPLRDLVANRSRGLRDSGLWRHRRKDGVIIDVDVRGQSIVWCGRDAVMVCARDVTALLGFQSEKRELLERQALLLDRIDQADRHYRMVFEGLPGKYMVIDPLGDMIITASDEYLQATLTDRESIRGRPLFEVFPDDASEPGADGVSNLRASLDSVISTGKSDIMPVQRYPVPRPDGEGGGFEERYWSVTNTPIFNADGEIVFIVHRAEDVTGFVRDATGHGSSDRDLNTRREIINQSRELKAANLQLREYEIQLNMVQRLLRLSTWRLDLDTGEMQWSGNIEEILGIIPRNFTELEASVHPEERESRRGQLQAQVDAGQTRFQLEFRALRPDGGVRYLRGAAERTMGLSGSVITGALQDVTEQLQQQREAESLAERLRDTLESMSDAFYLIDSDFRFVFVNSRAAELLRRSNSELVGRLIWDEFPQAAGDIFREQYEWAAKSGQGAHFKTFYTPLETWFEVNAYPANEGLAVYFRDVTRSHLREQQLRLLETAVSRQNDMLVITERRSDTSSEWQVAYVNNAVTRASGFDREQLIGQSPQMLVRPGTDPAESGALLAALAAGEPARLEMTSRRRDGREIVVDVDMVPLLSDAQPGRPQQISHWVWVARDISDRVEAEQQARLNEERERQTRKLEAVGQLTGGVAHDFNNLLTVLLGNAELLREQLDDRPQLLDLVDTMINASVRGAELTGRLLAFARRQPLEPRVLDVHRVLAGMDAMLRRTFAEDIEIELVRGARLWHAEVDPGQLEVSLLNLAINARDAMPHGGRLTLETTNVHIDDQQVGKYTELEPGQYVMISVSDSGSGMPAELLDQIFEPFFTTKPPGKGTGLGLSMVYGFVRQSGGYITIYSEPGEGTTVRLYFPRALGSVGPEQPVPDNELLPGHGEHILVVEDDAPVRDHAAALLVGLGYRVTCAASGAEALKLVETQPSIDLLFTDVIMPGGMNGRQLADAACAIRPELRVLFTSGYSDNAIVHHGRLDRGVNLLSKPYRRAELAAKVHKVLMSE